MRTVMIIAALAALSACVLHAARTNVVASTTYVDARVRDATNALPEWTKSPAKPTYTAQEVGATTPADVTAAIRDQSLGGIWDSQLEVWWTPIMENGALRYVATTNVNLSAEGNQ